MAGLEEWISASNIFSYQAFPLRQASVHMPAARSLLTGQNLVCVNERMATEDEGCDELSKELEDNDQAL